MTKFLAAAVFALMMLGTPTAHAADVVHTFKSGSVQIEKKDRKVKVRKVTYTERWRGGRLYAELNNGATFAFVPCRYEDSNNCYWDATRRGNGIGRSYIQLRGKTLFI